MFRLSWKPATGLEPPRLVVEGELDISSHREVLSVGCRAAPRHGGCLVVDLAHVTFFDGWAAQTLTELVRTLGRRGTAVEFVDVPRCVSRIFDVLQEDPRVASAARAN